MVQDSTPWRPTWENLVLAVVLADQRCSWAPARRASCQLFQWSGSVSALELRLAQLAEVRAARTPALLLRCQAGLAGSAWCRASCGDRAEGAARRPGPVWPVAAWTPGCQWRPRHGWPKSGAAGHGAACLPQTGSPLSAASASSRRRRCSVRRSTASATLAGTTALDRSGRHGQARPSVTQVSGRGRPGTFGPLAQTLYKARRPAGGVQFTAIGTVVRAPGARRLRQPFTCELSGQDFSKLISTGWVPVGLVLGISVGGRHGDRLTRGQTWWSAGHAEVLSYTELVNDVRRDARSQFHLDVQRVGAEDVVIADVSLQIRERGGPVREVGQRDHIAEATIIGTAIARFSRAARRPGASSLPTLSLDPQRRQAACMGDSTGPSPVLSDRSRTVGERDRTRTISLGIRAVRAAMPPDLGARCL
jgi:hypothetical protein